MQKPKTISLALAFACYCAASLSHGATVPIPDDPLHNYMNPYDVNGNGLVSPLDALLVINELERLHGSSNTVNSLVLGATAAATPTFYWDTTGDGTVSPLDVLVVINQLNSPVVPEPSTAVMSSIGLALLGGYLWRRKRRQQ